MGRAHAQLNVLLAQEHRVATHCHNGALGRDPGAGTALAEGHGDGLAGQRAQQVSGNGTRLDCLLMRGGITDKGDELLWSQVSN